MAHEVGKVEEVTLYKTSDGSVFDTLELATAHETEVDRSRTSKALFLAQKEKLSKLSRYYSKVNGYYRMITGNFFGTNNIYDGLTSMVLDTPETTLTILTSLDSEEKEK